MSHLGAIVIDARRCSLTSGANRFVLWKSQSKVFCRKPHERFMRSETSVFMISDGDVNGTVGKSTVNLGLQMVKEFLSNFELIVLANFIYFDALADDDGEGGGSVGGSFSMVSHGHTAHAVPDDSKVVSSCFVGSLNGRKHESGVRIYCKPRQPTARKCLRNANKMHP